MRTRSTAVTKNFHLAQTLWGNLPDIALEMLEELTEKYSLRISSGDLVLLDGRWYVTHSGLLRIAHRSHCVGIHVRSAPGFSDPASSRWAFRATVYRSRTCKGFVGYGDADPSNVSPLIRGAEMRVAETRAVNRAIRKAYGIGICTVEEIGSVAPAQPQRQARKLPPEPANGDYGGPTVRDRLCQIIRQHQLDPNLVKSYATDFCRVNVLREANRAQLEAFIAHLAEWAEKDKNALLCQLNSYLPPKQGTA